ncbi:MAG TPA: hypothetical protein VHM19_13435 [Polyangiales bacterium]|nr:hypothetical protein [Polyangiales bacterium]
MDLALERLRIPGGYPDCKSPAGEWCIDNEAFERLVSQLAVAVSPPVTSGAATIGPAGFYVGVSGAITPISMSYVWRNGTVGDGRSGMNKSPDGELLWNRLSVRKGLPFGLEVGTSVGRGFDTSMWVLSAEAKWAVLEGFHSGLGHFPDLAVRGVLSSTVGARQLSLRTNAFDVTLSKPYVVAQSYRLTPLLALQALFVHGTSARVDISASQSAWNACAPKEGAAGSETGQVLSCDKSSADLANDVVFRPVSQTRLRAFAGAEVTHEMISSALTVGYDLTVPSLHTQNLHEGLNSPLSRQITFQLSLGLRY